MINYNRVVLTRDVRAPDGVLRAARGAKGTIRSSNQRLVGVLFDSDQDAYVEPAGDGTLFREVPFIDTDPEGGYPLPK